MWWSTGKLPNMVEPEQWWPEVEDVEEALLKDSATIDVANGHRLDKYGDANLMDILDLDGIGANIDGTANGRSKSEPGDFPGFYPLPESPITTKEDDTTIDMENEPGDITHFFPRPVSPIATDEHDTTTKMLNEPGDIIAFYPYSMSKRFAHSFNPFGEVIEEEAVELEFEKVKPKLTTHSMHCPQCKSEITKVILRRKVLSYRPRPEQSVQVEPEPETEILKSIVYGGLMEVIASLSVVASAAASDATTLSIISVALASLMGGVFVIGHNLWDLRDDCYKDSSNNEAVSKYKELLGQVNYFPLHAFFAILSFLVFGMVPPVAYVYAFHETNAKDFTVAAVATASLICVALLAIFKAYINKCTIFEYFKTVVYYITTAVSVSGVSYVTGNLVTRLMEEYGLFGPSSDGGMSFFPDVTASLASF